MDARAVLVAASAALSLSAQQFQFMGDRQRSTSVAPTLEPIYGFAAGDLDGDGARDVVATQANFAVIYRRVNGVLVQSEALGSPIGSAPGRRPLVLDIDNDGSLDIVVGPDGVDRVLSLYPGNALPGTLVSPLPGVLLHAFACGDIDGDGDADFVVSRPSTSLSTQGVLVLRLAFGSYQIDSAALPGGQPAGTWPVLADVDTDGDLDLVLVGAPSGFRLLRNTNGLFVDATATLPATGPGRHHPVTGDFDGDGRTDIAALDGQGRIDVLWSTSTGFVYQPSSLGSAFDTLAAGDIDADGDADLVGFDTGFVLLRSNGNRTFASEPRAGDSTPRTGAALVDFDGDGRLDVLTAYDGAPPRVRCAYGSTLFEDVAAERGPVATLTLEEAAPLAGDFDGDGRTDILRLEANVLDVQLSRGAGRYTSRRSNTPMGPHITAAECGDFDRDGDLDVAVLTSLAFYVWANDGLGNFSARSTSNYLSPTVDGCPLATGDFDRDGRLDFAFLTDAALLRVPGLPGNTWGPPIVVRTLPTPGAAQSFAAADFDRDGDLDLATSEPFVTGTLLLVNNGAGVFTPSPTPLPFPSLPFTFVAGLAAGDVDNDNDADLFAFDQLSAQLLLLQNQGNGSFVDVSATNMPPPVGFLPRIDRAFIEDVDADGDRDILIAAGQFGTGLLLNIGNGRFLDRSTSRVGLLPDAGFTQTVNCADYDDDGDLDLAFGTDARKLLVDHLRHLVTAEAPQLGGTLTVTIYSGPSFGPSGLSFLAAAPNLLSSPLAVPGFAGKLELDPSAALLLAVEAADIIGVTQAFIPVPANPQLLGIDVFLQAATVPFVGTPGFGNCVVERVRP